MSVDASNTSNETGTGQIIEILSAPVSVRLWAGDRFASTDGLPEPVDIEILAQASKHPLAKCMYFDEELQGWSTRGVTSIRVAETDTLVCRTTHFTVFAATEEMEEPTLTPTPAPMPAPTPDDWNDEPGLDDLAVGMTSRTSTLMVGALAALTVGRAH